MVTSIQVLVYRIDQILETTLIYREKPLSLELREDLKICHRGIETTFDRWSRTPETEPVAPLKLRLEAALCLLEKRVENVISRGGSEVTPQEEEDFFRLLGGYRGVSEAALAYAGAAQVINWDHWREERFS
jgi:hypothetical protein